jgi:hypothetical protein
MTPDLTGTAVKVPSSTAQYTVWTMPKLQPVGSDEAHATLDTEEFDPEFRKVRRIVLVDGSWVDHGPAPSLIDDSVHPDLPGDLAEYVMVTRRVMSAIRGCTCVDLGFDVDRDGSGDWDLKPNATFRMAGEDTSLLGKMVPDAILDRIPDVRYVERAGYGFKSMLAIQPHDDGSGYEGDFTCFIRSGSFEMDYDGIDGERIRLRSTLIDGLWSHATELTATTWNIDPVEMLRITGEAQHCLDTIVLESDRMQAIVGGKLPLGAKAMSHSAEGAEHVRWAVCVEPGTLLESNR